MYYKILVLLLINSIILSAASTKNAKQAKSSKQIKQLNKQQQAKTINNTKVKQLKKTKQIKSIKQKKPVKSIKQVKQMKPPLKHTTTKKPVEEWEFCGYLACPKTSEEALIVHIVPATHAEMGYTKTFFQHLTGLDEYYGVSKMNMKNIFDAITDELYTVKARKFTVSDIAYFFAWWDSKNEKVRRKVKKLVRQGRLSFVGGGFVMSDESVASYHAIIDLFTLGLRKLSETFPGCGRPLVSWQIDNYGHSREFASLMALMGFDGHFISPISFDDEVARMKTKSLEFVWRGNDDLGSRSDIYTHKLFDGYWSPPGFCFGAFCTDPHINNSNVEERVSTFIKLMLERQAPFYNTKHVMVVMGQRTGYHDARTWFTNIDKLIESVNSRQNNSEHKIKLFYSTPACFLKGVWTAQPRLATKQDDFFPYAHDKVTHATGMYTSRPSIKYMAREMHLLVQIAKQLQVFTELGNNYAKFEEIKWITGVINDHSVLAGAMWQSVSDYYAQKIHIAKQRCMELFNTAFNSLRNAPRSTTYHMCPFNASSCYTISGDSAFIVVYNPLAWPVTLPIRLPVHRQQYFLYDPDGALIGHSIIPIPDIVKTLPERSKPGYEPALNDELVFLAERLPPMGFRSYFLEKTKHRNKRTLVKHFIRTKKYFERQLEDQSQEPKENTFTIPKSQYLKKDLLKPVVNKVPTNTSSENTTLKPMIIEFVNVNVSKGQHSRVQQNFIYYDGYDSTPPIIEEIYLEPERMGNSTTHKPSNLHGLEQETTTTSSLNTLPEQNSLNQQGRTYNAGYFSTQSKDRFIKNEFIRINLDRSLSKITSMMLSNDIKINLQIKMMFYMSDHLDQLDLQTRRPGVYVFRPIDPEPFKISRNPNTKIFKTDLVEEMHMQFAPYAGIAVKLYKNLPYVELDWVVGPIPVKNGLGKEVFIRYDTDLRNNDVFYTDCNGRQTIKRIMDLRSTHVPKSNDKISGNFYPISSKVYIEDVARNVRFSVFPDRGEGCTSLNQGQLDIMLHRRILTDDSGVKCYLNETELDRGLVVRGKHRLYLSRADYKPNKVYEKKLAREFELHPYVFTSSHPYYEVINLSRWQKRINEYSALSKKMPIGVNIMTIEKWDDRLLIRLENYLEKSDAIRGGTKHVYLKDILNDRRITFCKETMLGANIWREEYAQTKWQSETFVKNFNNYYGNFTNVEFANDEHKEYKSVEMLKGIELAPQEIRTFVCSYLKLKTTDIK